MASTQVGYYDQFVKWREHVDEDRSLLFVDGNVTFERSNEENVTYVIANSPSGMLSFMEKGKLRHDHWITTWQEAELVSYGTTVNIKGIEEIVSDNMLRIGGIARYAFLKGGAQAAINYALAKTDAQVLMKLVTTGIQTKDENRKVVDRLLHYHDPKTVRPGCKPFSFASEYVASRVAQVLCLEEAFTTAQLLAKFQGIGHASSFRGILFEAYAARKLSEGGSFVAKKIGGTVEEALDIAKTGIYRKPTSVLNKTNYPPNDIKDMVVLPSPEYNLPAIDMLMFLSSLESCLGFQMTVTKSHSLSLKGMKVALRYFDSVCRELTKKKPPSQYCFYFAVPPDIYLHFSNRDQEFVDKAGAVAIDAETKCRVEQWILKVE
jgi:hypothetical protein